MKNLFLALTIIAFTLVLPLQAKAFYFQIDDFDLDFSSIDSDFSSFTGVDSVSFDTPGNDSTIIRQELNSDGKIFIGADFEETGYMRLSSVNFGQSTSTSNIDLIDDDGSYNDAAAAGDAYSFNVIFDGITGEISEIDTDNDTFSFQFDPGSGDIGFYLTPAAAYDSTNEFISDDGVDLGDSSTYGDKIVDFSIDQGGGQTDGNLGGFFTTADWSTTLNVDSISPEEFLVLENGRTFWEAYGEDGLLQASLAGDTSIQNQDRDDGNPFGQTLKTTGRTGDEASFRAVPEPTTLLLFGTGLLGLAVLGRKRYLKTQN